MNGLLKGYHQIEDAEVFISENEIVVTGSPKEDDEEHNCDVMGCSSINHVIFRSPVDRTLYTRTRY